MPPAAIEPAFSNFLRLSPPVVFKGRTGRWHVLCQGEGVAGNFSSFIQQAPVSARQSEMAELAYCIVVRKMDMPKSTVTQIECAF